MFALSRSAANEFGPSTPGAAAVAAAAPSASTSIRPHLVGQQAQELHSTATCTRLLHHHVLSPTPMSPRSTRPPQQAQTPPSSRAPTTNPPPTDTAPPTSPPQPSPNALHTQSEQTTHETEQASPFHHGDPRFILYTSGSNSKPKGVVHSTAGYLLGTALTVKHVFDVHEDDRFACVADVGWITGHSYISTASHERGAGRTHNTGH
ncbi:unnamed protein product [Tilletia caries]|nr:unnamed protein product [Tilletia caries]